MCGEPVVLWVGRLTENKDPLTVLSGFELALQELPTARLYMVYGSEELLPQVRARVESSPTLKPAVTLLGSLAYADLEAVYNSADYFVLGSHREGASGALVEALACGVIPVVTDVPSSRRLTNGGTIGAHWPPGEAPAFASAFVEVTRRPIRALAEQAVRHFEEDLSWRAISRQALAVYQELAAQRAGRKS
jgi:glycosyltransferase involved in cell wall biosynthesis